ncbi:response regulator transcription factor [Bacillus sp. RG28]|uniref:Response regulator transcription factor n=1 Tax=Gottfriedia endophytica TaxID=2820819 RepID=A0A940SI30_9BACI|nr:response regulator transcription factor [Gottfriedia endophytica]MBP0726842.1 response regulator transcription factor [Gottfriedia endophytica]
MKKRILIIEDEIKIARVLKLEIEYEGYEVLVEHDGREGLEVALNNNIDLVLLDVMLPGLSGLEVLRRIRKANSHLPIILLTARGSTFDKITGLDYGANDYITKPFEIEEVLARVRSSLRFSSLLQQSKQMDDFQLSIGDLVVNQETREVKREDIDITLTPKEFDLLVYLLKNQNKVVTREAIILTVWGYEYEGETNVVDVYIRHLRKKIEEGFETSIIQTVRGVGYTMRVK